jgi:hypothetical protein
MSWRQRVRRGHADFYGKLEGEGPNIFAASDVRLEERGSGARSQIPFQSFFGKCRVLLAGPLQEGSFKLSSSRQ